jgi:hypothetical protein
MENNLLDTSGNGNAGTVGAGAIGYAKGQIGNGLQTNGTHRVNAGDNSDLRLPGSYTIAAWIFPTSFGGAGFGRILDKGDSPFANGYVFLLSGATSTLEISHRNAGVHTGPASVISLNTWQHVAATYDGATSRLYKNGTLISSKNIGAIASHTGDLQIANRGDNTRGFVGTLDDVQIWNAALQPHHIRAIYNGVDPAFIGDIA